MVQQYFRVGRPDNVGAFGHNLMKNKAYRVFTSAILLAIFCLSQSPAAEATNASPPTFYDVRDFGAKGDGKTLDTAAINKAIEPAAKGGGTVYFPAGTI